MTLPAIPMDAILEFLVGLLNTPSPTGDTEQAMAYVEQAVRDLPLSISRTVKGGLVLTWPASTGRCSRCTRPAWRRFIA